MFVGDVKRKLKGTTIGRGLVRIRPNIGIEASMPPVLQVRVSCLCVVLGGGAWTVRVVWHVSPRCYSAHVSPRCVNAFATEFWWWWLQDAKPKYTHGVSAATAIVNYNASPNDPNRPTSMPIYQSSTFIQPSATEFQVGSLSSSFVAPPWSLVESLGRSLSYQRLGHVGLDRVKYARTHAYKHVLSLSLPLMIYLCRILFSVTWLPTGLRLHSLWQPYSLGSRDPSCRFRNVCTCLLVQFKCCHMFVPCVWMRGWL